MLHVRGIWFFAKQMPAQLEFQLSPVLQTLQDTCRLLTAGPDEVWSLSGSALPRPDLLVAAPEAEGNGVLTFD